MKWENFRIDSIHALSIIGSVLEHAVCGFVCAWCMHRWDKSRNSYGNEVQYSFQSVIDAPQVNYRNQPLTLLYEQQQAEVEWPLHSCQSIDPLHRSHLTGRRSIVPIADANASFHHRITIWQWPFIRSPKSHKTANNTSNKWHRFICRVTQFLFIKVPYTMRVRLVCRRGDYSTMRTICWIKPFSFVLLAHQRAPRHHHHHLQSNQCNEQKRFHLKNNAQ